MRRSRPRPLGEIMSELVESLGAESRLGEGAVISAWQDVSGRQVSRATEAIWIEKKRLFVKLSSASWRQELHLERQAWCDRLNEQLGREAIDEIVFR